MTRHAPQTGAVVEVPPAANGASNPEVTKLGARQRPSRFVSRTGEAVPQLKA